MCKKTFMLYYDIGKHALKSLQEHVQEHGVTPRTHGNKGRKPAKSIMYDDVKRVVTFLQNVADERDLPQPAAPRGNDNIPFVYLTSSTTKYSLQEEYKGSCRDSDV